MNDANGKTVLLGIGGGIAAFKAVQVASTLSQKGYDVHVAMTSSAQEFIKPLSFAAVINRSVMTSTFPEISTGDKENIYPHLFPATKADICVLLPATANLIANVAHGFGSGIVSTCTLSLPDKCHRYYCPAMNAEMWAQQSVQNNRQLIDALGWQRIGPESGHLACGVVGEGRMTEPASIIDRIMQDDLPKVLHNKRILILSGPTIEHIDPVRFISNGSSGKMGKELAMSASHSGAVVDFVSGPVASENLPVGNSIRIKQVKSANEMLYEAENCFPEADIAIFVAAVSDYMPLETNSAKLPKQKGEFGLKLENTPDIAATLGKSKNEKQICISFALETIGNASRKRKKKVESKNLDAIVLNGIKSFGGEKGHFTYIPKDRETIEEWGVIEKSKCAHQIIDKVSKLI